MLLNKLAALGLTAALAFAPIAALAQDATPTPAATPAAGDAAAPAMAPKAKHHHHAAKHMMKKSHHMAKHHMMKKKMDAPAGDAAPAPDAPK